MLALYDPQRAERWMQLTGHDLRTVLTSGRAQWTWMLGYPDQAAQISDEQDAHARRLGHAFNLGFALTVGAYAFDYRSRARAACRAYPRGRPPGARAEHSFPVPSDGSAGRRSRAVAQRPAVRRRSPRCAGVSRTGTGLAVTLRVPYLKSALAEALALQGILDAALEKIDECLEQIERPGWQERSHLAEVLRLKGLDADAARQE